jgi:hypothetical protein
MSLLERILTNLGQQVEGELASTANTAAPASARSLKSLSSGQATVPIYQISPLPLSLDLKKFRDAWSGSNPQGDPIAALQFRNLVDQIPALAHEFQGSSSIEMVYGGIVNGASSTVDAPYLNKVLAEAKRSFDSSGQSNLATQEEWRLVETVPDDWYTDDPDRYSWLEIPLDGPEPDANDINLLGQSSPLMFSLGNQGQKRLSEATQLRRCRIQYMFVQFRRPWMNLELFKMAGWWLTGQPTGYCSSGRSDANEGVLPLITTGMIITRAIEFDGWTPTEQARINSALEADQDVHVGPLKLSKPGESVSSVNVVAWRSVLVPFSPQSEASNSGSCQETSKVVYKDSTIKFLAEDGRYIGSASLGKLYYYAFLGHEAMPHRFGGVANNEPLVHNSNLPIITTERFKDTRFGKWSERTHLGAFSDSNELYYWDQYGSKTNWILEKVDTAKGLEIHYGDEVYIRNEAYGDQYLKPSNDNYLTTRANERYKWRILKFV